MAGGTGRTSGRVLVEEPDCSCELLVETAVEEEEGQMEHGKRERERERKFGKGRQTHISIA